MRSLLVFVVACSFEPGSVPSRSDGAMTPNDGTSTSDGRVNDARPADARVCPPPPNATCTAFTCGSSSSCYYVCGTTNMSKASWSGARASCVNGGLGCIVTINDQAEQDCIVAKTMPTFATAVWFGFRQPPGAAEPDQGWAWECGSSSYVYPAWGSFEPNDQGGGEDCAAMTDGGGWFDADCAGTARYVCELP